MDEIQLSEETPEVLVSASRWYPEALIIDSREGSKSAFGLWDVRSRRRDPPPLCR
jgi:hypothetical protein